MKIFNLYIKDDKVEVTQLGKFNWWAFGFTYVWAFFQGLYLVAWVDFLILCFLGFFVNVLISDPDMHMITWLSISLINRCVFGFYGNYWKTHKLVQRGYAPAEDVKAKSAKLAIRSHMATYNQ